MLAGWLKDRSLVSTGTIEIACQRYTLDIYGQLRTFDQAGVGVYIAPLRIEKPALSE